MSIIWKEDSRIITEPVSFGEIEPSGLSDSKFIDVSHDLDFPIGDCGFFISPVVEGYTGARYGQWDYDQLLWIANNYTDKGLALKQTYTASGVIENASGDRVIDFSRTEPVDIFTGGTMEILDGPAIGQTRTIADYDEVNKFFTLSSAFSGAVIGYQYKIDLTTTTYIKSKQGSSLDYPILLLNKGGIIDRNETVTLELFLDLPSYPYSSNKLLVNLNLNYFETDLA